MSDEQKIITIDDFKLNFTVIVSRYEVYPREEPTCYCVGLIVRENTGKGERYIDTQVPFSRTIDKTENEIVKLGFDNMTNDILSWATVISNRPSIVGKRLTL